MVPKSDTQFIFIGSITIEEYIMVVHKDLEDQRTQVFSLKYSSYIHSWVQVMPLDGDCDSRVSDCDLYDAARE